MLTFLKTTSTLMVFMLAMVLYPDIQRHAQAVIDSVIGTDRLPTFEDRSSIPYIDAVLRETLRWHPIGPLGNSTHRAISPLLNTILQEFHMRHRVRTYMMVTLSRKVRCFRSVNNDLQMNILHQGQLS
jgi:hypothetical protein